jgi:alkylation response protein AidB-like acyl-CoA dehydrogenase
MVQFELTPEQQQRKETVWRFAAEEIIPVAATYDEQQTFPEDLARKAWEVGAHGLSPCRKSSVARAGAPTGASATSPCRIARNLLKG